MGVGGEAVVGVVVGRGQKDRRRKKIKNLIGRCHKRICIDNKFDNRNTH